MTAAHTYLDSYGNSDSDGNSNHNSEDYTYPAIQSNSQGATYSTSAHYARATATFTASYSATAAVASRDCRER